MVEANGTDRVGGLKEAQRKWMEPRFAKVRILNRFEAGYNCVIVFWPEQAAFIYPIFYESFQSRP